MGITKNRLRSVLILVALVLLAVHPASAKEPKKMAILPFTMNADRDLTFLQEGITDMLASRLAWKGEVDVLEKGRVKTEAAKFKGPLSRETALAIGKNLQADYIILGSLTVFGDSVSIDAKILDVAKAEELVTAFNQAKGMDAVIPTVTQFAQDINEKVMGRAVAAPVRAATPEAPKGPGGLFGTGQEFEGAGVAHTQGIKEEVTSLDVGDVDGDGKNELVLVGPDTVHVYKWKEKGFVQFKAVKEKWGANYVCVTVADLDGNGRAEIYVSNAVEDAVSSFVLEWDGNQFRRVVDGVSWLLKVVDLPGKGKVLLGQRGGFNGDVMIMRREGGNLVPTEPVLLPSTGNVFNFALADFDGRGKIDAVVLNWADYLVLYDGGKEEIWKSDDYFGGTYTIFKRPTDHAEVGTDHVFIPAPIYVVDVDGDGKKEVMVCKNYSRIGRLLDKMRFYSSGALHFMVRDEAGLSTKWTTKKIGGAMVGYAIADVDDDKLPELIILSVIREERMYGTPRSRIVIYDLK